MQEFGILTPAVIAELEAIVGRKQVTVDRDKLEAYSHDETPRERYAHMPDAAVLPASTDEVAAVVALALRERIPITPRGAGSGLSGGAIPVFGGIVLSLERMNRILEIDRENMVAVVEPGVITNSINDAVAPDGLFFAGYPMSVETCFVGGNVAENAGGGRAVKYGVTGRYVLGMEVVTPTAKVLHLGGKRVKDVTGYDLKQLFVGSEGTLGIVTKVIIRLLPLPKHTCTLLVLFPDPKSAISAVPAIMTGARVIPTSLEFMDRLAFDTACRYLNDPLDYGAAGAMLLVEVDGADREEVDREAEQMGEICMSRGAMEVYVADNRTTRDRVWAIRRNIAEAFITDVPLRGIEDFVVPISAIPELVDEVTRISEKSGILMPNYGHAGDGNLHVTLVKPPELTPEQWYAREDEALGELYAIVKRLGGTLSGEHGIGCKRREWLEEFVGREEYELMRSIKELLDPAGIMNPGKMFERSSPPA